MSENPDRRDVLKTALTVGAVAGFPSIIPSSARGQDGAVPPSERVNIAVLGCGAQSRAAMNYVNYEKSQIVAACDPIKERRLKRAEEWGGCADFNDFRDVLANKDIDAVHIATPDHWHVPLALAAARAGKDIYCEKPLGVSIEQNLAAREIVTKYKRVFQYGAQQRSMQHLRMGHELILNGHIGDVQEIYVWAPKGNSGGGSAKAVQPVPEGTDYDLWLGPAPRHPYSRERIRGRWHIYDYAIGFIAGWGAHPLDQLQWWADKAGWGIPVEYSGHGSIGAGGIYDTVTHWNMVCRYANGVPVYFMDDQTARFNKNIPHIDQLQKFGNCTMYIGTKGAVALSRSGWVVLPEEIRMNAKDPGPIKLAQSRNHQQNFVDSIISREQPVGTLESAIRSDLISHMGDLCIRTGETLRWNPEKETVVGSSDAVKMMHRPMRAPWTL
jgi:predicted dehydrogenase